MPREKDDACVNFAACSPHGAKRNAGMYVEEAPIPGFRYML
jgi:hypothetical protein